MRVASISKIGDRELNEDCIGKTSVGNIQCFILADGLGGHDGGEIASSTAVSAVIEEFKKNPELSYEAVYSYISAAQNTILEVKKSTDVNQNMATTIVVLLTDGRRAIWGHIGDSRLYRFERNSIMEVTDDHSVAFESFLRGECLYRDIRKSPDQNKLLRTLGNSAKFEPHISQEVNCTSKSAFLICTDGFWEYVDENSMEEALKSADGAKNWLLKMLRVFEKNAVPGNDNYSVIAIVMN